MHIDDLVNRRKDAMIRILKQGLELSDREKNIMKEMIISPTALIARVFYYDFQARVVYDSQDVRDEDIAKDNDYYTHCMPFAFVIKAGDKLSFGDQKLEYGDVIKLYDRKVRTLVNPRHAAYYNNSASNSNAERIGSEPSRFIHLVHENFRDRVFFIDPLKEPTLADFHTFNLPEPEIFGLFKNPNVLLDGIDILD